jgi:tartrate dehydrogenase/decarboxylase / D-malate dehydrogenase
VPNNYRIALIPGDNIGPEVVAEGVRILAEVERAGVCRFSFETFAWGAGHVLKTGRAAPENIVELLQPFDAIYMGAHGDPANVPDRFGSQQLMHPIRKGLELYANLRPVKWWPGTDIPLRQTEPIDFIVVRENTEGEYSNTGGSVHQGTENEVAMQTTVITRRGAERIIRYAFELARKRNGKKYVHCVTKSNALAYVMVLWDKIFAEIAAGYPDIRTTKAHIDATSMYVITRPSSFDVMVTTNLMGDIISDEAAAATGSIGLAPSANVNPERKRPGMFEPIHGSAPDIAGRQKANPIAAILAAALMLDWLGESEAAKGIERSVGRVLEARRVRTPDLGGTSRTAEITDAVLAQLREELGLSLRA